MIEVPAAVMMSDVLADEVDFFSIGTNDLTQYTCAADRLNEQARSYYNPYNPGVLRMLAMTVENGHKGGVWVGMCGSLAAKSELVPFLLGIGLDEFSVNASSVLPLRAKIGELKLSECQKLARRVLECSTSDEVKKTLGMK